jgi:N-acetylglucosamine malate deacetylase 1
MPIPPSLTRIPKGLLDRIRTQASQRLLRRMHRLTQRLPVQLRTVERQRVLMIAPHMDDEVIGAGGALALHKQVGSHVSVVFCAAGKDEEQDRTRTAEARAAAEFMGFDRLEWLGFPEGNMSPNEAALGQALAQQLTVQRPEAIFCPFLTDHHRDHNAVAQATALATRQTGFQGEIWCYEVWSPLWPNVAIDISQVADRKRRAIELHASQVIGLHYPDGILGLNRYRALRVYVDYAEAYFVCSAREFQNLADVMNRLD